MIRTACFAACATATLMTAPGASAAVNLNGRISQVIGTLQNHAEFSSRDFSLLLNWRDGSVGRLFVGLKGVRELNGGDIYTVNEWLDDRALDDVSYDSGYTFTHEVVGSYFGKQPQEVAGNGNDGSTAGNGETGGDSAFDGKPYKFTHEVLNSYFGDEEPDDATTTGESGGGDESVALFAQESFNGDMLTDEVVISDPDTEETPVIQARLIEPPAETFVLQVPAAVPEPRTWAMMIGGFALVGATLRRRRTSVRIA